MDHVRFPTAWFGEEIKNENGTYICAAACFHLENNNIIIYHRKTFMYPGYGPAGYTHVYYVYIPLSLRHAPKHERPSRY